MRWIHGTQCTQQSILMQIELPMDTQSPKANIVVGYTRCGLWGLDGKKAAMGLW